MENRKDERRGLSFCSSFRVEYGCRRGIVSGPPRARRRPCARWLGAGAPAHLSPARRLSSSSQPGGCGTSASIASADSCSACNSPSSSRARARSAARSSSFAFLSAILHPLRFARILPLRFPDPTATPATHELLKPRRAHFLAPLPFFAAPLFAPPFPLFFAPPFAARPPAAPLFAAPFAAEPFFAPAAFFAPRAAPFAPLPATPFAALFFAARFAPLAAPFFAPRFEAAAAPFRPSPRFARSRSTFSWAASSTRLMRSATFCGAFGSAAPRRRLSPCSPSGRACSCSSISALLRSNSNSFKEPPPILY